MICLLALLGVPTPDRPPRATSLVNNVVGVVKDLWQVIRQRSSVLAFIICFLPICTGAIPFAAIASEWNASADTVALVTGLLSGVISAVGCIIGGWMCDRMDRKAAYIWFGIFQAAAGVAMALLPRTQTMFIVWGSVYNFSVGLTYAAFSAFVLEAIGKGAAATKYNTLASLTNMPIYYMTIIDGWAHDHWNSTGMFFTESGLALVAAVIFAALAKILLHGRSTSITDGIVLK
jgi:MFS family permease